MLLTGVAGLLVSCNTANKSATEQTIQEISDNQKIILKKMEAIEKGQKNLAKSVANLALAGTNKPADKKPKQPQADPNKVYNIEIGDSYSIGPNNAKVTLVEWMDFQ